MLIITILIIAAVTGGSIGVARHKLFKVMPFLPFKKHRKSGKKT